MRRFLTAEQTDELEEHLGEILAGDTLRRAVFAIDYAGAFLVGQSAENWQESKTRRREELLSAAKKADDLLDSLARSRPPLTFLEPTLLMGQLQALAVAARVEAMAFAGGGRGRPPDEWRDRLVSVIFSVYPPGEAKKTPGSHFEHTVEIALAYLDQDRQNVHGLILRALRRQPLAPFQVS